MSTYVLVHGAWHGGWCWEKVAPLLERAGHVALAPDLPGHGDDRTPLAEVTLDLYVRRVSDLLDALAEPAILVGHSMGGIVISAVAEARPTRIARLVYVAAYLPRDGQSLLEIVGADVDSALLPDIEWAGDGGSASVAPGVARETFYAECSNADAAAATARLVTQATAPAATPVHITDERFGSIPRIYVECLHDRVVSPALQRAMYEATPCERVASLETDHSPFYSAAERLADILLSVAS